MCVGLNVCWSECVLSLSGVSGARSPDTKTKLTSSTYNDIIIRVHSATIIQKTGALLGLL